MSAKVARVQGALTTAEMRWNDWLVARQELLEAIEDVPGMVHVADRWEAYRPGTGRDEGGGATMDQWLEAVQRTVEELSDV